MSNSVVLSASHTSIAATPSATWHVGLHPKFPPSLTLSDDAAIESLVTDIPFLSVGLLGFGAITFFFAMRKFDRLSLYAGASAIVAFVAGVLDVGQVLTRGETAMNTDTDVYTVLPLLISREIALALSIGIRFLFFWTFVSKAPRGERPLIRASQEQKRSFLRMESDVHSGRWTRWGPVGALFKYTLLLAIIAIPVLQLIWRLVAQFSKFGPVYNTDGALQIAVSALLILKLFANTWFSPLTPRWKTIRDYSPVIIALLIGLGIGIGHIMCFQFSETPLARLLQAVELYILVLYVLISSFYHQRLRTSIVLTPERSRNMQSTPFKDLQPSDGLLTSQIMPVSVSITEAVPRTFIPTSRPPDNRLSSWLVPRTSVLTERPGGTRRTSNVDILASWLVDRGRSGKQDRVRSRLGNKDDIESGTYTADEKTGVYAVPFDGGPTKLPEATRKDPGYNSIAPSTRQRPEDITTALDAPLPSFRRKGVSPDGTISSFSVGKYGTEPPRRTRATESPVYGLEGLARYHDKSPLARPESVESTSMESLLRQQAELDKSVAELQMLSSGSYVSTSAFGGKISGGRQAESTRSDFSLSNFPEPPSRLSVDMLGNAEVASRSDEVASALKPLRIPTADTNAMTQQSIPSNTRWSGEDATGRVDFGSGTQYDVTSFIGDLTTPALNAIQSASEALPVVTVTESASHLNVQMQTPLPARPTPANATLSSTLPAGPRSLRQGLPRPILRANVETSTAYERPRLVPVP